MNTIKIALIALFLSASSIVFAQPAPVNTVNVNELVATVGANPTEAAALTEQAVRSSPDQLHQIVEALLAAHPDLAEDIIYGAVAGMPAPLDEDALALVVSRSITFRPSLAPEIAVGARRATTGMNPVINRAAVDALREVALASQAGMRPGQQRPHSVPGVFVDGSILSPAR